MTSTEKKREMASEQFYAELQDTFFFQTHRVTKALFRHGNRLMQESGVDLQMEQFPVLMTIDALKSASQKEIADILMRDKSSIQRSVTTLQKKGLLAVEQDGTDKRRSIVSLTKEGSALARKTKSLMRKADEIAFSHFSDQERADALQSMSLLADKLEKL